MMNRVWLQIAELVVAQSDQDEITLQADGMVMMILSISIVAALAIFCTVRILREKSPSEHHHVPLDIDTHDVER